MTSLKEPTDTGHLQGDRGTSGLSEICSSLSPWWSQGHGLLGPSHPQRYNAHTHRARLMGLGPKQ